MNISQLPGCSNCGCCLNVCPTRAISLEKSGLYYTPRVNGELCTDCGICRDRCPVLHLPAQAEPLAAFAAKNPDRELRLKSSSGGAFSALAALVLNHNGLVFGAAFSRDFSEVVFDHTDHVDLDLLRRSKYVESLAGDVFQEVLKQLETGRQVLFCATPCQAAGLRAFLPKPFPNLILCDFLCGGLPSHRLFQEYLTDLSGDSREVTDVNFREKVYGWSEYAVRVCFSNGKSYLSHYSLDPFFSAFLRGKCSVRENCLDCPYVDRHVSDLTLGDLWTWRSIEGIQNDQTGLSLVLANTSRGLALLSDPELNLELSPLPPNGAWMPKPSQVTDAMREKRQAFLRDAKALGLRKSARQHTEYTGFKAAKRRIKNLLQHE